MPSKQQARANTSAGTMKRLSPPAPQAIPSFTEQYQPARSHAGHAPNMLTPGGVLHLQRTLGNRAVGGFLRARKGQRREQAVGGVDFRGVNVHPDVQSDQLNRSIQAKAFTTGQGTFFRQGEYNPGSRGGQELIAHELTHGGQQNGNGQISTIQRVEKEHGMVKVGISEKYLVSFEPNEKPSNRAYVYKRLSGQDKNYPGRAVYERLDLSTKPEQLKRERKAELSNDLGNKIYKAPREGFELLIAELYASSSEADRGGKDQWIEKLYQFENGEWTPNTDRLVDNLKTAYITELMKVAYQLYDSAEDVDSINAKANDKGVGQIAAIKGVGIGFHSTSQPMDVVAAPKTTSASPFRSGSLPVANKSGKTGWGGLQKTKDLPIKRRQFALDEPWNPLKKKLEQGAHYRKGVNFDNELLSTVSVATIPGPAIKFPFPEGKNNKATSYLYSVIVEKAYPTFTIQKDPFAEVAVDKVDPKDIIGVTKVDKDYDPTVINNLARTLGLPESQTEQTHETFAYDTQEFQTNPVFSATWRQNREAIISKAKETLINHLGKKGIYNNLKITKG